MIACSKEGGARQAPTDPEPAKPEPAKPEPAKPAAKPSAAPDLADDGPCPRVKGHRVTATRKIGIYGRILPHELGWVWQSDTHVAVHADVSKEVQAWDGRDAPKHLVALDDDAWYSSFCDPKCDEHGFGRVVTRVERATGKRLALSPPQASVRYAEVIGDNLYWGTHGADGETGEFRRVPRKGGEVKQGNLSMQAVQLT